MDAWQPCHYAWRLSPCPTRASHRFVAVQVNNATVLDITYAVVNNTLPVEVPLPLATLLQDLTALVAQDNTSTYTGRVALLLRDLSISLSCTGCHPLSAVTHLTGLSS